MNPKSVLQIPKNTETTHFHCVNFIFIDGIRALSLPKETSLNFVQQVKMSYFSFHQRFISLSHTHTPHTSLFHCFFFSASPFILSQNFLHCDHHQNYWWLHLVEDPVIYNIHSKLQSLWFSSFSPCCLPNLVKNLHLPNILFKLRKKHSSFYSKLLMFKTKKFFHT